MNERKGGLKLKGQARKITIDPWIGEIKIGVFGEAPIWEWGSTNMVGEAFWVKISYNRNTVEMVAIRHG